MARTGQEHDGKQNKNDMTYNRGEAQGRERRGETENFLSGALSTGPVVAAASLTLLRPTNPMIYFEMLFDGCSNFKRPSKNNRKKKEADN